MNLSTLFWLSREADIGSKECELSSLFMSSYFMQLQTVGLLQQGAKLFLLTTFVLFLRYP